MTKFNKSEMLSQLGIEAKSNGTSTGSQFFANGEYIESYSPVDGELIGMVKTTTKEDYEKVMFCLSRMENEACSTAWRNRSSIRRKT